MKTSLVALLVLSCMSLMVFVVRSEERELELLNNLIQAKRAKDAVIDTSIWENHESYMDTKYSPVYMSTRDGSMEDDKIDALPGQPKGVDFDQYSGYVTVDPKAGRALFYYFVESPEDSSTKPLVLWLNGGPGCSSLGAGAMMELGPFRVKSDGKTLNLNQYAWSNAANVIFLESPAGVGFSYSNTTSDYDLSGDKRTAEDSYTFLVNWLEKFPQYKNRDFFITGESYAGHYVPQLAQTILHKNKISNQTLINLKGIAIGNALIDDETASWGIVDFLWSHALTSDEIHEGLTLNCNFSSAATASDQCQTYIDELFSSMGEIYGYNIYAPLCNSNSSTAYAEVFDPCTPNYVDSYLNLPQVQSALHVTGVPYPWAACSGLNWQDSPTTILPTIQELMDSGISVWIYSGDVDRVIPVTSSRYAINSLNVSVETPWYPWSTEGEVGGYAVGYEKLTFVTVRGAGHFVPSYQPARALTFFTSFLQGKLPPA